MADRLETQNPVDVAIDEVSRKASGSAQWFLEGGGYPPITRGNALEFMICGEEGFGSIANDLRAAQSTVDIVCWGFDPGMELERTGNDWRRGDTYGDLLESLARRGVTVRLLIWYNPIASAVQNNMPGYTDDSRWSLNPINMAANLARSSSPYANAERQEYCTEWWQRNLPNGSGSGADPNLLIVLRDTRAADSEWGFQDEEDQPAGWILNPLSERGLMGLFATHHQKPVLIDYAHDNGRHAVGYVMGLNSVTDYWDTEQHYVDTGVREQPAESTWQKEIDHEYESAYGKRERRLDGMPGKKEWDSKARKVGGAKYASLKPYRDYACRVAGPALACLHRNFINGWNAAAPKHLHMPLQPLPPAMPILPPHPANQVQIVRTQPHEQEKTIKALYDQATSYARNYIYIENQYFFYPHYVRKLVEARQAFCKGWKEWGKRPASEIPPLHLFIVIPRPENSGMVPRTSDALNLLGHEGMPEQQANVTDEGKLAQHYPEATPGPNGQPVIDREGRKKLMETLGIKVSVAMLRTSNVDGIRAPRTEAGTTAYREIYIHSKLMLIDDVFVTLGSANLNQRSMAVDSEINIAATDARQISLLRERIFRSHSNGLVGGSWDRNKVNKVFEEWNDLMRKNELSKKDGRLMNGFLLPFEDHRESKIRVAQITIPKIDRSTEMA